jgi:hypothetical protein
MTALVLVGVVAIIVAAIALGWSVCRAARDGDERWWQ